MQLEVAIKELVLPDIDNSHECLYEGLVMYETERHAIHKFMLPKVASLLH